MLQSLLTVGLHTFFNSHESVRATTATLIPQKIFVDG